MATNRYDNIQPLNFDFSKTQLQPLVAALQAKQQRYNQNFAVADELSSKYIDALDVDKPRANRITSDLQGRIDKLVETTGGDYSALSKDLYAMKRDTNKLFGPQGEAGAIMGNKAIFSKRTEEERERLKKGEITEQQFNLWYKNTKDNYSGVGDFNPVSGSYNVINPDNLAKYVDPYSLGIDIAKELEPFVGEATYDTVSGDWVVTNGSKKEILPKEYVASVVGNRLAQSDEYMNYLTQTLRYQGVTDPSMVDKQIGLVAENLGNAFARNNVSTTHKLKERGFELAKYKKGLDEELLNEFYRPDQAYDAVSSAQQELPEMTVNSLTQIKEYRPSLGTYVHKDQAELNAQEASKLATERDTFDVVDFVYSGKASKNPEINASLLRESIKEVGRKPDESNKEYSDRVFDFYNKSRNNSVNTQFSAIRIGTTKQQEELGKTLLSQADAGNASVVVFEGGKYSDHMTLQEAMVKAKVKLSDIYNEKTGEWTGKVSVIEHPSNTKAPNGAKINIPGKKASLTIINWSEGLNRDTAPVTELASVRVNEYSKPMFLEHVHEKPIVSKREYAKIASGDKKGQLQEVINIYEVDETGKPGRLLGPLSEMSAAAFDGRIKEYMPRSTSEKQFKFLPN